MMKVFIDTNIFLDILCKREQFVDDALSIFDMAVDNKIELLISDLSIANIKYITRKEIPIDKFYDLIQTFRPIFTIVPLGADVIDKALDLKANDFEDALQYFSAVQANVDCLVTRNIKDFGFAKMEILDSQTFLAKYNNVYPQKEQLTPLGVSHRGQETL